MIFMSDRSSEERHDSIPGILANGALVPIDLMDQKSETSIHDLMDLFRVELLRERREVGHFGKEDRHQFSLSFERAPGSEDFVS
jgi:hypothetical protein